MQLAPSTSVPAAWVSCSIDRKHGETQNVDVFDVICGRTGLEVTCPYL